MPTINQLIRKGRGSKSYRNTVPALQASRLDMNTALKDSRPAFITGLRPKTS